MESYGLDDLTQLHFISDRGPNLVKALKPYRPLYCYGHRLNNLLKRTFFQSQKKKKNDEAQNTQPSKARQVQNKNQESDLSTSASEDEDESFLPIHRNKKKTTTGVNQSITNDPRKLQLVDLDSSAQEVIKTIVGCKKLVKYVKKVSKNVLMFQCYS